jgi:FkbM family methyltransferase
MVSVRSQAASSTRRSRCFVILLLGFVTYLVWFVVSEQTEQSNLATTLSLSSLLVEFESFLDPTLANKEDRSSGGVSAPDETSEPVFKLLEKDGGFCAATSCPAGKNAIREAWTVAPNLPDSMESISVNQWANVQVPGASPFQMLTRDSATDKYISGTIQRGQIFDAGVRANIIRELSNKESPVFIDIGANIGYMSSTALALGATVISFEPFQGNAGILMSTARRNGWRDRLHLYMNPVSYESATVSMKTTNKDVNLSNMHISASQCSSTVEHGPNETYGVDYMEAVSLDQVMLTKHADIAHVDLMKIDVETHEMQVINGGMHFLCNRVVNMIIMEVEYLKPIHKMDLQGCDFSQMQDILERMGFQVFDYTLTEQITGTGKPLSAFPGTDAVFVQKHKGQPPAQRLTGTDDNPCEAFKI